MKKLPLLIAAGIGYVLGTRDGRERYDQIRDAALKVRNDPRVQEKAKQAADVAREISGIQGVTLAEDVTGPYDVIVRAEANNVDELGKLVVAQVQNVTGITRTLTCPVVHL